MNQDKLNILSLFDGMSCMQIALKELNKPVGKYYASEVDKYAIQQTQHNFPNTIQVGDVTKWKEWDIEWSSIDVVCGGSPCQGFSFAGKQLNFGDERSKLFFVFVDILNHIKKVNPDVIFLLENVNMKKEYLAVINKYLGINPVNINSNLVSAQNRNRWYWTNIKTKEVGLFGDLHTDIPQPKDRGILLKDVLQDESEVDEKYYMKNPKVNFEGMDIKGKCNTLRTGGKASQSKKHNFDIIKLDKKLNLKSNQNKAGCLIGGGNSGGNHSDMDIICVAMRGRNPNNPSDRTVGVPTEQRLEPKTDGKTNCLTSVSKDNLIFTKNYVQWDVSGKGYTEIEPGDCVDLENPNSKTRRGRKLEYKSNCLMATTTQQYKYTNEYKLRRLTPIECARLQTIPDWHEWIVSDTQIYRMLGNGWTVEIIKHILK